MSMAHTHEIGRHRVELVCPEGIGPATPYSLLLAENIPDLQGLTVVDVGTGSGIQAIVALLQGAARAYVLDVDAAAIAATLANAARNGVAAGIAPLVAGGPMLPLPPGVLVDMIICNPAQLPMPEADRAGSAFFYAGRDGRQMIDALIRAAPERLAPGGRLLMTHGSMADLPASLALLHALGLEPRIVAQRSLEFRPFINRAHLDELGGVGRGLYELQDGRPFETVRVVEATRR